MDSAKQPRPGSLFERKEVFLERSKDVLSLMKDEADRAIGNSQTTQFTEGVNAPTVMIRAAVAKTISESGRVHLAIKTLHGWTVRSINRIVGRSSV